MSTSDISLVAPQRQTARDAASVNGADAVAHPLVVAREAVLLAAVVMALTAALAPRDLGTGFAPHVGWVVVILLAARHGGRGFGFGLFAGFGALALTALGMGVPVAPLLKAVGNSRPDLIALVVSMLVATVASTRERRVVQLVTHAAELGKKSKADDDTIGALRDAAVSLRARADRLDHCVTFLREVAARLEGSEPLAAAQAALDLALARTAAEAGAVVVLDGGRPKTFALLGNWVSDVVVDGTIAAAFGSGAPARACDLPGAGPEYCDVATPIVDEAGRVFGVLALRGVPADSLRHTLVHDLGLIAQWCAKAMRHHVVEVTVAPAGADESVSTPAAGDSERAVGKESVN
jgi:hypothetical protein